MRWETYLAAAFVIVGCLVKTAASQQPAVVAQPGVSQAEADALVAFHNKGRAEVGVPPLAWSPKLATVAQAWADHLAAVGKFEHRPAEGDDAAPYGENLAIGNAPNFGLVEGARGWYAEKEKYIPGTPIPSDFTMLEAGHYTQMIWTGTKLIGAGKAVIASGEYGGWTVIVCNYDPPGNAEGQTPYPVEE